MSKGWRNSAGRNLWETTAHTCKLFSRIQPKHLLEQIIGGVPLTAGWTYKGAPAAQAKFKEAEIAFSKRDFNTAAALYQGAAALDPAWYDACLFAGDMYFRMNDWRNAGIWFQKAIDIDPDRDTGYRYWGDALYRSGDAAEAKLKYEQAVVAQPYDRAAWLALQQWATVTRTPMRVPQITRPDFTTPDGKLKIDPALMVETGDGHASWLIYQKRPGGTRRKSSRAVDRARRNGHQWPHNPKWLPPHTGRRGRVHQPHAGRRAKET